MTTAAAAPWKTHHAAVRLPGTRSGRGWVFGYVGTHPQRNGSFEEVRGDIVVVVAPSQRGSGVEFFALRNKNVQFRTHHDSVLLPSTGRLPARYFGPATKTVVPCPPWNFETWMPRLSIATA